MGQGGGGKQPRLCARPLNATKTKTASEPHLGGVHVHLPFRTVALNVCCIFDDRTALSAGIAAGVTRRLRRRGRGCQPSDRRGNCKESRQRGHRV
jgi:hypothetical protein